MKILLLPAVVSKKKKKQLTHLYPLAAGSLSAKKAGEMLL